MLATLTLRDPCGRFDEQFYALLGYWVLATRMTSPTHHPRPPTRFYALSGYWVLATLSAFNPASDGSSSFYALSGYWVLATHRLAAVQSSSHRCFYALSGYWVLATDSTIFSVNTTQKFLCPVGLLGAGHIVLRHNPS